MIKDPWRMVNQLLICVVKPWALTPTISLWLTMNPLTIDHQPLSLKHSGFGIAFCCQAVCWVKLEQRRKSEILDYVVFPRIRRCWSSHIYIYIYIWLSYFAAVWSRPPLSNKLPTWILLGITWNPNRNHFWTINEILWNTSLYNPYRKFFRIPLKLCRIPLEILL